MSREAEKAIRAEAKDIGKPVAAVAFWEVATVFNRRRGSLTPLEQLARDVARICCRFIIEEQRGGPWSGVEHLASDLERCAREAMQRAAPPVAAPAVEPTPPPANVVSLAAWRAGREVSR